MQSAVWLALAVALGPGVRSAWAAVAAVARVAEETCAARSGGARPSTVLLQQQSRMEKRPWLPGPDEPEALRAIADDMHYVEESIVDGKQSKTKILQSKVVDTKAATDSPQIAWLHIPKCGVSFGTWLFHYANASLPEEARIPNEGPGQDYVVPAFQKEYPVGVWFQDRFWEKDGNIGDHTEITPEAWERFRGNFFGMFRQPAARMYSSWNYFARGSTRRCKKHGVDAASYARRTVGVATKMVAGQASGMHCTLCPPRPCEDVVPNIELALARLDGFRFVGLTEQWPLSVCLFHTMFGGKCLQSEFANARPGHYPNMLQDHDKIVFDTAHDPYDEALYAKAAKMFWLNVEKYKVTRESCMATCPGANHIFEDDSELLSVDVD
mmetsp:Transcript_87214/g.241889  ORF Transcript_87214/g.241889 Transcript_87214/m.241889 type:complete len:382 (-) Transcript_87214:68-1213(-)